MSDTLNRVNNWTGEIVSGVDLPLLTITYYESEGYQKKRRGAYPVR